MIRMPIPGWVDSCNHLHLLKYSFFIFVAERFRRERIDVINPLNGAFNIRDSFYRF